MFWRARQARYIPRPVPRSAPPYADTLPFLGALIEAFSLNACLWASDWPFLRAPQRLDLGPLLRVVERMLPDAADRRRLFWETPQRWLNF